MRGWDAGSRGCSLVWGCVPSVGSSAPSAPCGPCRSPLCPPQPNGNLMEGLPGIEKAFGKSSSPRAGKEEARAQLCPQRLLPSPELFPVAGQHRVMDTPLPQPLVGPNLHIPGYGNVVSRGWQLMLMLDTLFQAAPACQQTGHTQPCARSKESDAQRGSPAAAQLTLISSKEPGDGMCPGLGQGTSHPIPAPLRSWRATSRRA